jgi:hypothetical protein
MSGQGEKWTVVKQAPKDVLTSSMTSASSPTRVTRTILASNGGGRAVTISRQSSIVYDPTEHRFVNSSSAPNGVASLMKSETTQANASTRGKVQGTAFAENAGTRAANPASLRTAPARPAMTPPALHSGGHGSYSGSPSAVWNGGTSGNAISSTHTSTTGSSGSHPSGGGGRSH